MTPAETLSAEVTRGIERMMAELGFTGNPAILARLEKELAAKIQQVADEQQQSDAQAFGDECECDYGGSADVTVIITPLFPEPSGNN